MDAALVDGWVRERRIASDAAWQSRREWKQRAREEFGRARSHGLAARHRAKLARIHEDCVIDVDGTFRCVVDPAFTASCPSRPATASPSTRTVPAQRPAVAVSAQPAVVAAGQPAVVAAGEPAMDAASRPQGVAAARPAVVVAGRPAVVVAGRPAVVVAGQPAERTSGRLAAAAEQCAKGTAMQPAPIGAGQHVAVPADRSAVAAARQPARHTAGQRARAAKQRAERTAMRSALVRVEQPAAVPRGSGFTLRTGDAEPICGQLTTDGVQSAQRCRPGHRRRAPPNRPDLRW